MFSQNSLIKHSPCHDGTMDWGRRAISISPADGHTTGRALIMDSFAAFGIAKQAYLTLRGPSTTLLIFEGVTLGQW